MTPIILDPNKAYAFTPEGSAITYHLLVPTKPVQLKWAEAQRKYGVRWWTDVEIAYALIDALNKVEGLTDEERTGNLDRVTAWRDTLVSVMSQIRATTDEDLKLELWKQTRIPDMVAAIFELLKFLPAGERLLQIENDRQSYMQRAGLAAAKCMLVGWEGTDVPFRRDLTGVPDDLIEMISWDDLRAIGAEVFRMMTLPEERRKNSLSRSGGSSDPRPSAEASTPAVTTH